MTQPTAGLSGPGVVFLMSLLAGCLAAPPPAQAPGSDVVPDPCVPDEWMEVLFWELSPPPHPLGAAGTKSFSVDNGSTMLRFTATSGPHVSAYWSFEAQDASGSTVWEFTPPNGFSSPGNANVPGRAPVPITAGGTYAFKWYVEGGATTLSVRGEEGRCVPAHAA